MKLMDLRRAAIRKQIRIRYPIGNGAYCQINEQGVAKALGAQAIAGYHFEDLLAAASGFEMEPVAGKGGFRSVTAAELLEMAGVHHAGDDAEHED